MVGRVGERRAHDREVTVAAQSPGVSVTAETAYPISAPSARVRVAAFAPHLAPRGIELRFRPNLTDAEYEVVASDRGPVDKARELGRASARLIRRQFGGPDDGALLVHR